MRFILDALGFGGGGGYDKTYLRDLGRASYKSPSGTVIPFDFEDVESSIASKAAAFETATGNGTYVQPNGHTSGRFPMTAYFHGDGYEERAQAFVGAVMEPGVGQLSHPSYSVPINVVWYGEIRFAEPLKSAAGQAVIGVTFWETTGLQIGETESLSQLYDSFVDAATVDFAEKIQVSNIGDQRSLANKIRGVIGKIESVMGGAIKAVSGATNAIEDIGNSIDRGMDLVVGAPLDLARQVQIMIGEPRRQIAGFKTKWEGYKNLADDIFGSTPSPSKFSNDNINGFHVDKLVASSIVANGGAMLSQAEHFKRADYIESAEELKSLQEDLDAWRDDGFSALAGDGINTSEIDTGGGRLELNYLTGYALSELIQKSLTAKAEMRAPLASDRTPLDLCFELYGTAGFDYLDLFTKTNDLVGDENIIIPKGREIVWYV